jgi:CheY-like chemotaxis protein
MKILLVDDSPRQRRAAKAQLAALGHDVVATSSYVDAIRMAGEDHYHVALIDLFMPAEAETLGAEALAKHLGTEIAVGFPLAMALTAKGIKHVGMATDTNHHAHPLSAAVDWLQKEPLQINGSTVCMMHANTVESDGQMVKDWAHALRRLLAG